MIITNRNTGDLSFVVNLCTVICTNNADILLNLSAPFSFTVSLCYVVRTADLNQVSVCKLVAVVVALPSSHQLFANRKLNFVYLSWSWCWWGGGGGGVYRILI